MTVSVAGCLGYDVLAKENLRDLTMRVVSVAGCLGYDVLVIIPIFLDEVLPFQLLVV